MHFGYVYDTSTSLVIRKISFSVIMMVNSSVLVNIYDTFSAPSM